MHAVAASFGWQLPITSVRDLAQCILQAVEVRIALAGALAQQYFGILTRPKTLRDSWLLHGLAGYLRDVWVRKALGRNEVRYRSVLKFLGRNEVSWQ